MSTTPNDAKRARKAENGDIINQTTAVLISSIADDENNHDSRGNKWKQRLRSLRKSLTRKRVPGYKERKRSEQQSFPVDSSLGQENGGGVVDICFDNGGESAIFPSDCEENTCGKSRLSSGNCSSKDVSTSNHPIAYDNKTTVKKRKGFGRRTKGGTVRGNKMSSTSQQDLSNGEKETVDILGESERDMKRRRKRVGSKNTKSMSMFPSWFKTFGRSSSAKNLKLNTRGRGLSLSTGNFNEHDRNFKVLTDVRLLRDPGYVSSSVDSLDRHDDLCSEEKYNSLRRSRASLIDIRWHKHDQSDGNLASPKTVAASRIRSPLIKTSSRGTSSPNVSELSQGKEVLICNNNCNIDVGASSNRETPKSRRNRLRNRNSVSECVSRESCAQKISIEINCENCKPGQRDLETNMRQDDLNVKSFLSLPEHNDVYLTADEGTNQQRTSNLCVNSEESKHNMVTAATISGTRLQKKEKCSPGNEESVLVGDLPVAVLSDDRDNIKELFHSEKHDFLKRHQSEGSSGNISPSCLSKIPSSLSMSQPLRTLASSPMKVLDPHAVKAGGDVPLSAKDNINGCQQLTVQSNKGQVHPGAETTANLKNSSKLYQEHQPSPLIKSQRVCKSLTKVHSPTETCHDVVFMRPPKKPAPKPPSLMKNKSQSLTALAGKLPGLSEQLALSETSSVHKLNDSCGENLCELLSQSKGKSQSSEGVYVGILGDQGVILRKKRVLPKPKRVFSMPLELLENVMEVDGTAELSNLNHGSISEISSEHIPTFHSSGSDDYLSCNSKSPSPVVTGTCSVEKECCVRSLSISSIEVQDLSMQKKIHSQSVPCLINKECLSVKSTQDLRQDSILENVDLPSSNCFIEGTFSKDCVKCSTAQSMISLNHNYLFEDDTDTSEKVAGKPLMYAEALWDHVTMNEEELCFTAGQAIAVYDIDDPEWWFGLVDDHIGWFPASFVRIPVSGDLWNKYQNWSVEKKMEDVNGIKSENSGQVRLSKEEIRTKILEEIVNTEQEYVQNLKDIVEGYLKQARKRRDMFSDNLLDIIFSNIESIYNFHLDFLRCIQNQCEEKRCVGKIGKAFVDNRNKFSLYSDYCNNHSRALFELKNLLRQDKYRYFFEACRLLQEMIRISLDGFLLTPVQKICKYPLQLQELLKYTDEEHDDYNNVKKALEAMREVASNINEKKRKVENIKKIAEWQLGIEQWEGEDVLIKSSQLVHSGKVTKISKGRAQQVTLFLFDQQLVYCRKDLIKKRSLEYKGRMVLENYNFEKLEDGEVSQNGMTVKNAWRLSNKQSNTSCLFQAKTLEQRDKWVRYFLQERKIVYESTAANSIPLEERLAAMDAARNVLKSRKELAEKGEKKYGKFNTVSRALGQLHYGKELPGRKIELPPPVSSAMLFQRNQARSSFGLLRGSGMFKKRRPKSNRESKTTEPIEQQVAT